MLQGRESTVVYRWDGSYFAYVGEVDASMTAPSDMTVFTAADTTFMAVSGFNDHGSATFSIGDAVLWHGAVSYTDGYAATARFVVRSITGTTQASYNDSVLTVTLQPDREIPEDTLITIGGFLTEDGQPLSETPSTPELTLSGKDAATFGSSGVWDRLEGVLHITLAEPLRAGAGSVVTFALRTLKSPGPGAVPYITASGKITVPRAFMDGYVLAVSEVTVAAFADALIAEGSNVRGSMYNQITVQLRPNTVVPVGTFVTVSGLTGSRTPNGVLEMTGADAARFASSTRTKYTYWGTWNRTAGSFVVELTNGDIQPFEQVEFQFTISNGLAPKPPASPTVRTSGALDIPEQAMTCPLNGLLLPGQSCPVMSFSNTPAWGEYVIEDSHTRVYAQNTLTVTLRPNIPLVENDEITISDLETKSLDGCVFVGLVLQNDSQVCKRLDRSARDDYVSVHALCVRSCTSVVWTSCAAQVMASCRMVCM